MMRAQSSWRLPLSAEELGQTEPAALKPCNGRARSMALWTHNESPFWDVVLCLVILREEVFRFWSMSDSRFKSIGMAYARELPTSGSRRSESEAMRSESAAVELPGDAKGSGGKADALRGLSDPRLEKSEHN